MDYKEFYNEIRASIKAKLAENKTTGNQVRVFIDAKRRELINENSVCKRCGTKDNLTLDHIVPISYLENFGLDVFAMIDEENFEILCRRCNQFKGDRLDFSNPKTKPLLLKFVNQIK